MSETPTTYEMISSMLVAAVLERWPATADVFHAHAMAVSYTHLTLPTNREV